MRARASSVVLAIALGITSACARVAPTAPDEATFVAMRVSSALEARIASGRLALRVAGHEIALGVSALGPEERLAPLDGPPDAIWDGELVRIARDASLSESWEARPEGLEHRITIARRPGHAGALVVALGVVGTLAPRRATDDRVDLVDRNGHVAATYAGLVVRDAGGRVLPARLDVDGSDAARILIRIDDEGARYPLDVDPILATQDATIVAADGATDDYFGGALAMSGDGARIAVGVFGDDPLPGTTQGSIRVFARSGATWTEEAALRLPSTIPEIAGQVVTLSSDARYLFSSAGGGGAVHVHTRSGTTWTYDGRIDPPPATFSFGSSIAAAADASRVVVGDMRNMNVGSLAGSAYVYARSGSTWSLEATLYAADPADDDWFGETIAISADGSRAFVAAPYRRVNGYRSAGSVYVYARRGTTWAIEAILEGPAGTVLTDGQLGRSLAVSADGAFAVLGHAGLGGARVFARTGSSWAEQAFLRPADGVLTVALSSDGLRVVTGAWAATVAGRQQAGSAALFHRVGTSWIAGPVVTAPDGASYDAFASHVALSADGTRAAFAVPQDDTGPGLFDAGSVRVFSVTLAAVGDRCAVGGACATGFCVDGVCCATSCGGGAPSDCAACSAALTGGADGTCAPLAPVSAAGVTCRPAAAACDAPETCSPSSMLCPPDVVASVGTSCRPVLGVCDAPETCDGVSATCPADTFASASVVCRPAVSVCDVAEQCSGTSRSCPPNVVGPAGTVCRPATGVCDADEICDGASPACPGDRLQPPGNVCRGAAGPCDESEVCDGTSASCPDDRVQEVGVVCLAGSATNPCDVADVCDGSAVECRPRFAPRTTVCAPAGSGPCDAPDHCAGVSADCIAEYVVGAECRPAGGACDRREVCSGSSPDCPPDLVATAGASCRTSTDPSCDPEETCDGTASSCPADQSTCMPRPDAGGEDAATRDAGPSDASTAADAGRPPPSAGCACVVASSSRRAPGVVAGLLVGLLSLRRRRRA